MNLTLKQLFKFGVVCASACALSASATDYVSDSFEDPEGVDGKAIGDYKLNMPNSGDTNWFANASDASVIVTNDPTYAAYTGGYPIAGADKELILSLDTAGNELSRAVTNVLDIEDGDVYVDTMVQFVLSDEAPVITETDIKVALYVNSESNLVVESKMYSNTVDYVHVRTNSVIDLGYPIDPAKWYRLSMRVTFDAPDTLTDIYIDGTLITHPNAYDIDNAVNGGSSFLSIDPLEMDLSAVSFKGTGLLDELVVSDTAPDISTPTVIQLVFAGGSGSFATLAEPDVSSVTSGTEVIMTAAEWYEITGVTGPIDETGFAVPANAVTTTVTSASDCTVTATVAQVDSDLADWAVLYGVSKAQADAGTYNNNYLLNISPSEVAEIVIESIVIVDTNITEITLGPTNIIDFGSMYGALSVSNSSDLVSWSVPMEVGNAAETYTITNGLNFIKAVVK